MIKRLCYNRIVMKVKICGITNLDDALVAAEAGADYLGFIFYPPSKRTTNVADVQGMVAQLRQLPRCPLLVGVFVDETAVYMADHSPMKLFFTATTLAPLKVLHTISAMSHGLHGRQKVHIRFFRPAESLPVGYTWR